MATDSDQANSPKFEGKNNKFMRLIDSKRPDVTKEMIHKRMMIKLEYLNRLILRPKNISSSGLMLLGFILRIHPYLLWTTYKVAANKLSNTEKEWLTEYYEEKPEYFNENEKE